MKEDLILDKQKRLKKFNENWNLMSAVYENCTSFLCCGLLSVNAKATFIIFVSSIEHNNFVCS